VFTPAQGATPRRLPVLLRRVLLLLPLVLHGLLLRPPPPPTVAPGGPKNAAKMALEGGDDEEDFLALSAPGEQAAVARFDHRGDEDECTLGLLRGQRVVLMGTSNADGWVLARNRSGEEGFVPEEVVLVTAEFQGVV